MGCSLLLVSKFTMSTKVTSLGGLKAGRGQAAAAKGRQGSTNVTSDMLGALDSFEPMKKKIILK